MSAGRRPEVPARQVPTRVIKISGCPSPSRMTMQRRTTSLSRLRPNLRPGYASRRSVKEYDLFARRVPDIVHDRRALNIKRAVPRRPAKCRCRARSGLRLMAGHGVRRRSTSASAMAASMPGHRPEGLIPSCSKIRECELGACDREPRRVHIVDTRRVLSRCRTRQDHSRACCESVRQSRRWKRETTLPTHPRARANVDATVSVVARFAGSNIVRRECALRQERTPTRRDRAQGTVLGTASATAKSGGGRLPPSFATHR